MDSMGTQDSRNNFTTNNELVENEPSSSSIDSQQDEELDLDMVEQQIGLTPLPPDLV